MLTVLLLTFLTARAHTETLVPCQPSLHLPCTDNNCVQRHKVCDGVKDCPEGQDEEASLCSSWRCEGDSVRCEEDNVCISPPSASLCSGEARCPDKSDQKFCLNSVFTGCFANTSLGLKIVDCSTCFCQLRNKTTKAGKREALVYKSREAPDSKIPVVAGICMERRSTLFCDGVEDCLLGEDEDGELCYKTDTVITDQREEQEEEEEEENTRVRMEKVDPGDYSIDEAYFDMTIIIVIFLISCISVVGICFLLIFLTYKLIKSHQKPGMQQLVSPSLCRQSSAVSCNDYVPPSKSPSESVSRKPTWSLRTTCIVKELGKGYYSKVYLAQDIKNGFVALKTVDNQKTTNSEECISNEIDILTRLGSHINIVKLLGTNREEKLIVMEYAFNGNLKDYISRYRDYYTDEINPDTGELREETFLYKSPTDSDNFPMSDFLSSMHADIDNENPEGKRKSRDVPGLVQNKSLIKTRRLLYWSYQVSKGMKYLADLGIIHRDVALRNMLLTNNDVVKIADFGLAVSIFSGGERGCVTSLEGGHMPQYWSRSNKPQPYKWMAVESLVANVYSQSSDVWSFAVMIWEMFTLGAEPYPATSPSDLSQALQRGERLEPCRLSPRTINSLMTNCWLTDPSHRPTFQHIVLTLSGYMSKVDRQSYEARSRLDSGIAEVEGYVDMMNNHSAAISTPSTGTASKSSTRSRTISKCSELSWLPSSNSSRVPSPKVPRASYWANYKVINSSESQVYSSVENYRARSHYAVPQTFSNPEDRQFSTLDTYLKTRNLYY